MTYVIIATTPTYAPAKDKRYLAKQGNGRAKIFATRRAAADYAGMCRCDPVILGPNESGPPSLKIAPIHSLPNYLTWQL